MQARSPLKIYDCVIIGSGPGGLLASVYLSRFRRSVAVIGNGQSRVSYIPLSHNYPGAVRGTSGREILKKLFKQMLCYQVPFFKDTVVNLVKEKNLFKVVGEKQTLLAKKVVLATGMSNYEPNIPAIKKAFLRGSIRHCMICDAFEVIDKKVAIIGYGKNAVQETEFLLTYTKNISLFTLGKKTILKPEDKILFAKNKVKIFTGDIHNLKVKKNSVEIFYENITNPLIFDSLYSALGSLGNTKLAKNLNARLGKKRCVVTDEDQQSSVSGLYAVGDAATGLKQMVNAFAHAAAAATAIHKALKK